MFPSSSIASSIASASFAAHATDNAETPNLKATLDALSTHLGSPVTVYGLPGSPTWQAEESAPDNLNNLTHLIFSDKAGQMSLTTHLIRNGHQVLVFDVTLPADDNLLFRGVATAALVLDSWNPNTVPEHNVNKDTLVATDAETFALRRIIECELTRAQLQRSNGQQRAYENGMRRLTPSPELAAPPTPQFVPNHAAKRPFPF